jgi:hypothetical protein
VPDNAPCRSEPARDGGLPSTIDFKQAIKNRKLSPSGLSELKDRSLRQLLHNGFLGAVAGCDFFDLLCNGEPASDHKFIEHFLPITGGLSNIKECQFITNFLFCGFSSRGCIHAGRSA